MQETLTLEKCSYFPWEVKNAMRVVIIICTTVPLNPHCFLLRSFPQLYAVCCLIIILSRSSHNKGLTKASRLITLPYLAIGNHRSVGRASSSFHPSQFQIFIIKANKIITTAPLLRSGTSSFGQQTGNLVRQAVIISSCFNSSHSPFYHISNNYCTWDIIQLILRYLSCKLAHWKLYLTGQRVVKMLQSYCCTGQCLFHAQIINLGVFCQFASCCCGPAEEQ